MIETVLIEDAGVIYDRLVFPYRVYKQWQNEETAMRNPFLTIGSSTAKIRERQDWNKLGREIYDVKDVERHASIISRILRKLKLTQFLVQQAVPTATWFRGDTLGAKGRILSAIDYLKSRGIFVDFSVWRGALIVGDEMGDFLKKFLDYPLILNSYDLEAFSTQAPLVMTINHHLSIEYTSPDHLLIGNLKAKIAAEGIAEFPERA